MNSDREAGDSLPLRERGATSVLRSGTEGAGPANDGASNALARQNRPSAAPSEQVEALRRQRRERMRADSMHDRVAKFRESSAVVDPRVQLALDSGRVYLIDRVSGPQQAISSTGSQDAGADLVLLLAPYGIRPDDPRITRAQILGEGAGWKATRTLFYGTLDELETGSYRLVLVMEIDRLARNHLDGGRFIHALLTHKILLLSPDKLYDVRNKQDLKVLGDLFNEAVFDHSIRRSRSIRGRYMDAAVADVLLGTPSGVIAADPFDRVYVEAMQRAGLAEHLSEEMLARHGEAFEVDGRIHLMLPVPDRDVYDAIKAMIAGIKLYQTPKKLADMIRKGTVDGWPAGRKGHMPVCQDNIWDQHTEIRWIPVEGCRIKRFLLGNALYGSYRHTGRSMRDVEEAHGTTSPDIEFLDLFPSFGTSEDEREVHGILSRRTRNRQSVRGAEIHVLDTIRCHTAVADTAFDEERRGTPCNRRLAAFYPMAAQVLPYYYLSLACEYRYGHTSRVFPHVEEVILGMVLECLAPAQVESAVQQLPMQVRTPRSPRELLQDKISALKGEAATARNLEISSTSEGQDAMARGDDHRASALFAEAAGYRASKREKEAALAEQETALRAMKVEGRSVASLARSERDMIVALASELPTLLQRAAAADIALDEAVRSARSPLVELDDSGNPIPGSEPVSYPAPLRRRILNAVAREVRLRVLEDSLVEITVFFPRGGSMTRQVHAGYFEHAYAAICYAWGRVVLHGCAAADVAAELNVGLVPTAQAPIWTANMVITAVLVCEWHGTKRGAERQGASQAARSLDSIVAETGEPMDAVQAAAFRGDLGLATWRDGSFLVEASAAHVARGLPEFARRDVARRMNWPLEDTIRLSSLGRKKDHRGASLEWAAERGAGIVRDDAGARYTRRSLCVIGDRAMLRHTLETDHPEWAALPEQFWMRKADAKQAGITDAALRSVPMVCVRSAKGKRAGGVYFYLDPDSRAKAMEESERLRASYGWHRRRQG